MAEPGFLEKAVSNPITWVAGAISGIALMVFGGGFSLTGIGLGLAGLVGGGLLTAAISNGIGGSSGSNAPVTITISPDQKKIKLPSPGQETILSFDVGDGKPPVLFKGKAINGIFVSDHTSMQGPDGKIQWRPDSSLTLPVIDGEMDVSAIRRGNGRFGFSTHTDSTGKSKIVEPPRITPGAKHTETAFQMPTLQTGTSIVIPIRDGKLSLHADGTLDEKNATAIYTGVIDPYGSVTLTAAYIKHADGKGHIRAGWDAEGISDTNEFTKGPIRLPISPDGTLKLQERSVSDSLYKAMSRTKGMGKYERDSEAGAEITGVTIDRITAAPAADHNMVAEVNITLTKDGTTTTQKRKLALNVTEGDAVLVGISKDCEAGSSLQPIPITEQMRFKELAGKAFTPEELQKHMNDRFAKNQMTPFLGDKLEPLRALEKAIDHAGKEGSYLGEPTNPQGYDVSKNLYTQKVTYQQIKEGKVTQRTVNLLLDTSASPTKFSAIGGYVKSATGKMEEIKLSSPIPLNISGSIKPEDLLPAIKAIEEKAGMDKENLALSSPSSRQIDDTAQNEVPKLESSTPVKAIARAAEQYFSGEFIKPSLPSSLDHGLTVAKPPEDKQNGKPLLL